MRLEYASQIPTPNTVLVSDRYMLIMFIVRDPCQREALHLVVQHGAEVVAIIIHVDQQRCCTPRDVRNPPRLDDLFNDSLNVNAEYRADNDVHTLLVQHRRRSRNRVPVSSVFERIPKCNFYRHSPNSAGFVDVFERKKHSIMGRSVLILGNVIPTVVNYVGIHHSDLVRFGGGWAALC